MSKPSIWVEKTDGKYCAGSNTSILATVLAQIDVWASSAGTDSTGGQCRKCVWGD